MKEEATTAEDTFTPTFTKLVDKHYSPLVIRKFTKYGFPIYVGIITDDDLSGFDQVILNFMWDNKTDGWVNDIQKLRNLAGGLTEHLVDMYPHTEGVGVTFYVDKCWISSLYGDPMNHLSCRYEYYTLIGISAHV